jgi:uncharacterized protein YukE
MDDMDKRLRTDAEKLESGGWIGKGSDAFSAEMNGVLYPANRRLVRSLDESSAVILKIITVLQAAEEDASKLFDGEGMIDGLRGLINRVRQAVVSGIDTAVEAISDMFQRSQEIYDKLPPWVQDMLKQSAMPQDSWQDAWEPFNHFTGTTGIPLTIPGILSKMAKFNQALPASGPWYRLTQHGWLSKLANNTGLSKLVNSPFMKVAGRTLAPLDFAGNFAKLAGDFSDPESWGDTIASGAGVYAVFASGPGALVAGAFSVGYAIGDNLVPDSWKSGLGDAMYDAFHDPEEHMIENYPYTTANDFRRNGQVPGSDVARQTYDALVKKYPGSGRAQEFWDWYGQAGGAAGNSYPQPRGLFANSVYMQDRLMVEENSRRPFVEVINESMNRSSQ